MHMEPNQAADSKPLPVDSKTQEMVNLPPVDPAGFSDDVAEFIKKAMQQVANGEINLFNPATLINQTKYAEATELVQGKADMQAVTFCSKLREIQGLMQISGGDEFFISPTYQATLLVQELKFRKEQFETQYGDLFVI